VRALARRHPPKNATKSSLRFGNSVRPHWNAMMHACSFGTSRAVPATRRSRRSQR
jgi:hypothetical protein